MFFAHLVKRSSTKKISKCETIKIQTMKLKLCKKKKKRKPK
jgi:hypothetical protein